MVINDLVWVGLGGCAGAVLRYSISSWVQGRHSGDWPMGTFTVNMIGCFAIGVAMALIHHGGLSIHGRQFWVTGLLGALTTFSTFSWETLVLFRDGQHVAAVLNVAANTAVGLIAVLLGLFLGRAV